MGLEPLCGFLSCKPLGSMTIVQEFSPRPGPAAPLSANQPSFAFRTAPLCLARHELLALPIYHRGDVLVAALLLGWPAATPPGPQPQPAPAPAPAPAPLATTAGEAGALAGKAGAPLHGAVSLHLSTGPSPSPIPTHITITGSPPLRTALSVPPEPSALDSCPASAQPAQPRAQDQAQGQFSAERASQGPPPLLAPLPPLLPQPQQPVRTTPHAGRERGEQGVVERQRRQRQRVLDGVRAPARFELSEADVGELERLAQFLGFGLFAEPSQAAFLTQVALHLTQIAASCSLHDLICALLAAVPDLLHKKLGLEAQPLLAATTTAAAVPAGGNGAAGAHNPAVAFAWRRQRDGAASAAAAAADAAGANSTRSSPFMAPPAPRPNMKQGALGGSCGRSGGGVGVSGGGGGGGAGVLTRSLGSGGGGAFGGGSRVLGHAVGSGDSGAVSHLQRMNSVASLRLAGEHETSGGGGGGGSGASAGGATGAASTGGGVRALQGGEPSRIKAVRAPLPGTLLLHALRASASQASEVSAGAHPHHDQPHASVGARVRVTSGGQPCPGSASVPATSVGYITTGPCDYPTGGTHCDAAAAAGATAAGAPTHSPASRPPPWTLVLPDSSAHVLEDQQPHRDVLLAGSLLGGINPGSIVLCVEGSPPPPPPPLTLAAAPSQAEGGALWASWPQGGGGGASAAQAASLPSLPALAHATGAAGAAAAAAAPGQLAMYLVFAESMPTGVLDLVVSELQPLMSVIFSAARAAFSNSASASGAGGASRIAADRRALCDQLAGKAAGAGGSAAGAAGVTADGSRCSPGRLNPDLATVSEDGGGAAAAGGASRQQPAAAGVSASAARQPAAGARRGVVRSFSTGVGVGKAPTRGPLAKLHRRLGMGLGMGPGLAPSLSVSGGAESPLGSTSASPSPSRKPSESMSPNVHNSGAIPTAAAPDVLIEELEATPGSGGGAAALASSTDLAELLVRTVRSRLSAAMALQEGSEQAKASVGQDLAAVELLEVLGRGGQGVVFRGTLHGLETAVKVLVQQPQRGAPPPANRQRPAGGDAGGGGGGGDGAGSEDAGDGSGGASDSACRQAKRGAMEVAVVTTLSHPNIVQVYAAFSGVVVVRCHFRDSPAPQLRLCHPEDKLLNGANPGPLNQVMCLEYCDAGTLLEASRAGAFRQPCADGPANGAIWPALVPLYTSLLEVALALRYLHSRGLVHCDVKAANVLLKGSPRDPRGWSCKLSDFGCVRLVNEVDPEGGRRGFRMAHPLGTVGHMAPECFVKGALLGSEVDVYAFGILMWELLMCRSPYSNMNPQDVPRQVLRAQLRPSFHPLAPAPYCALAARCWSGSPHRRPTAAELVSELQRLLSEAVRGGEGRPRSVHAPPPPPPPRPSGAAPPPPQPQQQPLQEAAPPPRISALAADMAAARVRREDLQRSSSRSEQRRA